MSRNPQAIFRLNHLKDIPFGAADTYTKVIIAECVLCRLNSAKGLPTAEGKATTKGHKNIKAKKSS